MKDIDLTTITIWFITNDIINTFKILDKLDATDISDVVNFKERINYTEFYNPEYLQLNVPIVLFTKLYLLKHLDNSL